MMWMHWLGIWCGEEVPGSPECEQENVSTDDDQPCVKMLEYKPERFLHVITQVGLLVESAIIYLP